jgi:hypothetical protein
MAPPLPTSARLPASSASASLVLPIGLVDRMDGTEPHEETQSAASEVRSRILHPLDLAPTR